MTKRITSAQILKSIAGSVLVGRGLLILMGNLDGITAQLRAALGTPREGLGLLSTVILAASFNHQRLLHGLLQMLVSLWPAVFVMVGAVLLRDVFAGKIEVAVDTQQIFPGRSTNIVYLTRPRSTSK
jgi:hypothetical protein